MKTAEEMQGKAIPDPLICQPLFDDKIYFINHSNAYPTALNINIYKNYKSIREQLVLFFSLGEITLGS